MGVSSLLPKKGTAGDASEQERVTAWTVVSLLRRQLTYTIESTRIPTGIQYAPALFALALRLFKVPHVDNELTQQFPYAYRAVSAETNRLFAQQYRTREHPTSQCDPLDIPLTRQLCSWTLGVQLRRRRRDEPSSRFDYIYGSRTTSGAPASIWKRRGTFAAKPFHLHRWVDMLSSLLPKVNQGTYGNDCHEATATPTLMPAFAPGVRSLLGILCALLCVGWPFKVFCAGGC